MNDPALYADVNSISRDFVENFTEEYEDEFAEISGRCLDIGSGPGDVTVDLILPKLNPKATIVCSDVSDHMVKFAKKKYEAHNRLSFIKLDIGTPQLPKDLIEKFDLVTSFYCINWCRDMRQVFGNIFNLLRPGGTVILTCIASTPESNALKELAAMPRYHAYMKDVDLYIPVFEYSKHPQKTLKALIKDVGFEVRHCSVRDESYRYDDLDVFAKFMLSVNPYTDRVPAELKNQYEEDLAKAVTKGCIVFDKNNDNEREYSLLYTIRTLVVHLRKPLTKKHPN